MTLTIGTGPFGKQSHGTFNFDTGVLQSHTLYFEDSPRRVRVMFNGETIADSKRVKLLHETGHLPVYYFPPEDVRMDLLEESDHTTHCPFKGDASYWSVKVGDRVAENATWRSWLTVRSLRRPTDRRYCSRRGCRRATTSPRRTFGWRSSSRVRRLP